MTASAETSPSPSAEETPELKKYLSSKVPRSPLERHGAESARHPIADQTRFEVLTDGNMRIFNTAMNERTTDENSIQEECSNIQAYVLSTSTFPVPVRQQRLLPAGVCCFEQKKNKQKAYIMLPHHHPQRVSNTHAGQPTAYA